MAQLIALVTKADIVTEIMENVKPERVSRNPSDGISMPGIGQAADKIFALFAPTVEEVASLKAKLVAAEMVITLLSAEHDHYGDCSCCDGTTREGRCNDHQQR